MTIVKHTIDAETAEKAVAAAAKKAAELKLKMCIAVSDEPSWWTMAVSPANSNCWQMARDAPSQLLSFTALPFVRWPVAVSLSRHNRRVDENRCAYRRRHPHKRAIRLPAHRRI